MDISKKIIKVFLIIKTAIVVSLLQVQAYFRHSN